MPKKDNSKKAPSILKKTNSRSGPDVLSLLKEDHKKVRGLLDQLEATSERGLKQRQELVAKIEKEIKVHTQLEEEIFYPAFKKAAKKEDDADLYFEAIEEHHVVDFALPELVETHPVADNFTAKVKVLKDLIEHHAIEEEEGEMFPRARKILTKAELLELGRRTEKRKTDLTSEPMLKAS